MGDFGQVLLDGLIGVLVVIPFPAVIANYVLWRLYFSDERRSSTLFSWAAASTVINIAAFGVGYLALRRLLGAETFPYGAHVSAALIIALECVPIYFAWNVLRRGERQIRE